MKLKEIRLKNFRCYEDLTVPLHEQLTVLVAPNGQGKTAILDAIGISLWTYVRGFDLGENPSLDIYVDDIRLILDKRQDQSTMTRQLPTEIIATNINNFQWMRFREDEKNYGKTYEDKNAEKLNNESKEIQQSIRKTDKQIKTLPIFLHYGVNRGLGRGETFSSPTLKLDFIDYSNIDENRNIRTFAYHECLFSKSDYRNFKRWFHSVSMDYINNIIKALGTTINKYDIDNFETYQKKLNTPISSISIPVNEILKSSGWGNPSLIDFFDIGLEHKHHGRLKISQLSDGIRNIFGMISDIAYRCYLLNSHLDKESAKETEGIVLIDEVDMHLHPAWQQTILQDLQTAFPKLQFIVTTHSPQVLTTVPAECIRIIDGQNIYFASAGTKGAEASRLLDRIFGVKNRPPQDENTLMLAEYRRLVYKDEWNSEKALELRKQLDVIFQDEEPELTALDLYIDNRKWEMGLEENQ